MMKILGYLFLIGLVWPHGVMAEEALKSSSVPEMTLSPDHRYGVTVPSSDDITPKNVIVEVATGRAVGVIQADVAFIHMNHGEIVPARWSANDSMVLWQVDGKWGYRTEVLIKLEHGKIKSQVDLLSLFQQEMLKRTREATPKQYASVKQGSGGYGSWFKDGFAIDCVLDDKEGTLKFPLIFHCFLTSHTKGPDDTVNVDSRMTVRVNEDGTFKVEKFYLGTEPPSRNWN